MKTPVLFLSLAVTLTASQVRSIDDAIIQTMRLGEAPNYSWITSAADDNSSYTLEGQTETAGCTWLKMSSIPALAEVLGLADERYLEALYMNRSTFLLRAAQGWVSSEEIQWGDAPPAFDTFALARGRPAGRMGTLGAPLPNQLSGRMTSSRSSPLRLPGDIHHGLTPPHEELGIIVSSYTDLQVQPQFASGTLSDLGAALLLIREEKPDTKPLAAAGIFRLWFQDGRVIRYQLRLEGLVTQGRKTIPLRTSTTTIIKDVGTTRMTVPEMARMKLAP